MTLSRTHSWTIPKIIIINKLNIICIENRYHHHYQNLSSNGFQSYKYALKTIIIIIYITFVVQPFRDLSELVQSFIASFSHLGYLTLERFEVID